MRKRKILKEAVVLLITTVMILTTVSVTANTNDAKKVMKSYENLELKIPGLSNSQTITKGVFSDDFDFYEDFVLDFPPWTQFDGDGSATYGFLEHEFPNSGYTGSYIIFNPSQCTPPVNDTAHSGEKYAACFNAVLPATNDDWLFTPQLLQEESGNVTFWAKRGTSLYEPDLFEVGVSTTDTNPSNFTIISAVEEPAIEWTEYIYNLDTYIGENIYIGIHCISYDAFWLGIDDFSVTGVSYTLDPDLLCEGDLHFGNVSAGATLEGNFTVKNIGGGLLDWIITHEPSWGEWMFDPEQGDDLEPGPGVTVQVTVVAPEEINDYAGTIVIENKENPDDFCIIDVSMTTPRNKAIQNPFLNFLQSYPNLFSLLQMLLQRLGL
jgi:hypothetical protein